MSGRYTRTAIVFHWVVAVLIVANVILAWTFKHWLDDYSPPVANAHRTIGITILGLALLRLLWRIGHRPPPFSPAIPRWQIRLARANHAALYALIVVMPLSGWTYHSAWEHAADNPISAFGLFDMPLIGFVADMPNGPAKETLDEIAHEVHIACSYLLYVLLAAHLAGAAKHQWFDRVPTLERMTFRGVDRA